MLFLSKKIDLFALKISLGIEFMLLRLIFLFSRSKTQEWMAIWAMFLFPKDDEKQS